MADLGAELESRSRTLSAKDDEIKKQQAILAQLQKQRNDLAENLAIVRQALAAIEIASEKSPNLAAPMPPTRPVAATADAQADRFAEILRKLESIENRLGALEKSQTVPGTEHLAAPKEESAPMRPPECPLASTNKDKTVKVVILGQSPLETRPEFNGVDRELSTLLSHAMQESFKKNEEKVVMVANGLVEKFKDEHPNWKEIGALEIGKHFHADYVIAMDVNQISLYEPGSAKTLFRGRCDISINVVDVLMHTEGPKFNEEYSTEYPKARGPIAADSCSSSEFHKAFLKVAPRELTWRFSAHPLEEVCRDEPLPGVPAVDRLGGK